jgi:hypothetical protein
VRSILDTSVFIASEKDVRSTLCSASRHDVPACTQNADFDGFQGLEVIRI